MTAENSDSIVHDDIDSSIPQTHFTQQTEKKTLAATELKGRVS